MTTRNTLIAVRLTPAQFWIATRIGGGNTSKGVRLALDTYGGRDIPVRYRATPSSHSGDARYFRPPVGAKSSGPGSATDPTAQAASGA